MKMDDVNGDGREQFIALFGGVYEHSPWVAASVADKRPFHSADELVAAMQKAVDSAAESDQLTLIRAHPDLAGKLAMSGELTAASRIEQGGLGLDRLSAEEFELFQDFNSRYREKFGFPFVVCVRLTDKAGILEAFRRRLASDPETERRSALLEIHHIARLRIADILNEQGLLFGRVLRTFRP